MAASQCNETAASELAVAAAARKEMLAKECVLSGELEKKQILKDAFDDGSSVVCVRCGDLIARARWIQHRDFWCEKL